MSMFDYLDGKEGKPPSIGADSNDYSRGCRDGGNIPPMWMNGDPNNSSHGLAGGLAGGFGAAVGGLIALAFMIFWRLSFAGKVVLVSVLSLIAGGFYLENRFQKVSYNDHLATAKQGAPILYSALSKMSALRMQEISRPLHEETLRDSHLLKVSIPEHDGFFAVVVNPLIEGHANWLNKKKSATFLPAGSLDAHALQSKAASPVKIDLKRNDCFTVKVDMVSGSPETTPVDMHGLGAPFYHKTFGRMFFLVVCTNPGTPNIIIDENWDGKSYESSFTTMVARQVKY